MIDPSKITAHLLYEQFRAGVDTTSAASPGWGGMDDRYKTGWQYVAKFVRALLAEQTETTKEATA